MVTWFTGITQTVMCSLGDDACDVQVMSHLCTLTVEVELLSA